MRRLIQNAVAVGVLCAVGPVAHAQGANFVPDAHDFGAVKVGKSSAPAAFTITTPPCAQTTYPDGHTDCGMRPMIALMPYVPVIVGTNSAPEEFPIVGNDCPREFYDWFRPTGLVCTVTVAATPQQPGARLATLAFGGGWSHLYQGTGSAELLEYTGPRAALRTTGVKPSCKREKRGTRDKGVRKSGKKTCRKKKSRS